MKQRIQGIIIGVLATVLVFGSIMTVMAAATAKKIDAYYDDYKIYVDGVQFESKDKNGAIEPFSYNGWIYAPFEHIAKALGKSVTWDGKTNSLYIGAKPGAAGEKVKLSDLDYFNKEEREIKYSDQMRINTGDYVNDCLYLYNGMFSGYQDYLINGQYTKIDGTIALSYEDRATDAKGYTFNIWGDGKLLYTSEVIKSGFMPISFEVNISGVDVLKIGFEQLALSSNRCLFVISDTKLTKK